jgi:Tol biopolymer transport system component
VVQLDTNTTIRASVATDGHQPLDGESHSATLSADGRFLAFASTSNLSAGSERPERLLRHSAIYVRDLVNRVTSCASCVGAFGNGHSSHPHLSADGRLVVFAWQPDRSAARTDIVLHDRSTGVTTIVTSRANASSTRPRLSANGRYIAFESLASNLACDKRHCSPETDDENVLTDIYLFDRSTGQFTRLSRGTGEWWVPSVGVSVDRDGTVVSFSSRQPLGAHDPTSDFDLFVHTLRGPR